jgi:hypothetical protein
LVDVLDNLRAGGDHASSIPVNTSSKHVSSQGASSIDSDRELATSSIKVLYRPNVKMQQLQAMGETMRNTAHIQRMQMVPASHAIVIRGTSEQVAQADSLTAE